MEDIQHSTVDMTHELVVHGNKGFHPNLNAHATEVEACLYDELENYVKEEVSTHIRSAIARR